jgi:hypothetical protein
VNQRLKVIPDTLASPDEFAALSPGVRLQVRDALNANLPLIEAFVDENPAHGSDDELDIVRSWRHLVHGQMDGKPTTREGEPAVEWTWDGTDEMDPAQGRGWAVVKGDELHGMIFFHGGDDSEFVAKMKGQSPKEPKP